MVAGRLEMECAFGPDYEDGDTYIISDEADPWVVAQICIGQPGDEGADARLIAAAPEMLEALRKAICRLDAKDMDYYSCEALANILREPFEKATGKSWEELNG
jgi:hypothetical protein